MAVYVALVILDFGPDGRFTCVHVANRLTQEQLGGAVYVVVGPNTAVLAMQRTLRGLGVSPARIPHERLTI